MKRFLASVVAMALPLSGMAIQTNKRCCCDPCYIPDGEPDLFKRCDQIVSSHAEFLYWTVIEGDLDYALKMRSDAWGPTNSYAQGRFEKATYGFDPGFRLGFLYFRAPHYWEVRWQYTRMTNRGTNHSSKPTPGNQFLTGTWPQITNQPLAGIKSEIHLNYNVFDWLITRVFFPNPHLRLRVLGGACTVWMDQDWKVRYSDSTPNTTTIRNKWHFVGAGLKSGSMADWYWTGDLYMTAAGYFGVLVGNYSNHARQTTTFQPTVNDDTSVPVRNASFHDTRPTVLMQMMLGPSYQKNFPCNRIEIFAGFEMTSWFNLQEIYRSTSGSPQDAKETWINSSLMALYGLSTRLTVDF